jgi:hypothetical protein
MPIVDDLGVDVERPLMADRRPTAERDARLSRAPHAKGITRPVSDVRHERLRSFEIVHY